MVTNYCGRMVWNFWGSLFFTAWTNTLKSASDDICQTIMLDLQYYFGLDWNVSTTSWSPYIYLYIHMIYVPLCLIVITNYSHFSVSMLSAMYKEMVHLFELITAGHLDAVGYNKGLDVQALNSEYHWMQWISLKHHGLTPGLFLCSLPQVFGSISRGHLSFQSISSRPSRYLHVDE